MDLHVANANRLFAVCEEPVESANLWLDSVSFLLRLKPRSVVDPASKLSAVPSSFAVQQAHLKTLATTQTLLSIYRKTQRISLILLQNSEKSETH